MAALAYTTAQLDSMGLSPADPSDEILGGGAFTRRLALQNTVRTTNQPELPTADALFATAVQLSRGLPGATSLSI